MATGNPGRGNRQGKGMEVGLIGLWLQWEKSLEI